MVIPVYPLYFIKGGGKINTWDIETVFDTSVLFSYRVNADSFLFPLKNLPALAYILPKNIEGFVACFKEQSM